MNNEVTAIKKRPRTFNELIGQEFIVATLTNSLQSNRIANAYLFSGPRGVGKTSLARILAKALNCKTGITPTPCGTCDACNEITAGNALDVIEIDGASHTSVNDVREIRDEVLFTPSSLRYKIYIIDEVHMLSNSAFNALLKTIEEPPPYVVFIFATTEIHKVPATIRSRCQQYNFRLLSINDIMNRLQEVATEYGIKTDKDSLIWIAKEATGSMRDAYTLFDQIASFSEDKISIKKIQEKLGIVGLDEISSLIMLLSQGNTQGAFETLNGIFHKGITEEQILISLSEYFRNLLLIKNGITKESILGYSKESFQEDLINAYTIPQTEKALELILELLRNFRFSINQHFEVELLIHRLAQMNQYITQLEILNKIELLKKDITAPLQHKTDVHLKEERISPESKKVAQELNAQAIVDKIIEIIGRKKLALASALKKNIASEMKNDEFIITFREVDKFSAEFVTKEKAELAPLVEQLLSRPVTIKIAYAQHKEPVLETADESEMIIKKVFKGSTVKGE
jgi:DNA polymerase-3 subunit gamma/tau